MNLKIVASVVFVSLLSAAAPPAALSPEIVTEDVDRFYAVYDAAGGKPTAEQLQRDYLDKGSDGLDVFARVRRITGKRIAAAMAGRPEFYVEARQCAAVMPTIKTRLMAALTRLGELYPEAIFPPVTLAIGRTKPVGTATATAGVMIGLEALCHFDFLNPSPEDRFVSIIAHEYVHVQQPAAQAEDSDATVLEASLIEGGAEFVAELIGGSVGYSHLAAATKGREKALEAEFAAEQDETAMGSDWLYNGMGTPERPGDLGYWVGYRIAKARYQGAEDKNAALKDIIEMEDAKAFLARSGWYPGVPLD